MMTREERAETCMVLAAIRTYVLTSTGTRERKRAHFWMVGWKRAMGGEHDPEDCDDCTPACRRCARVRGRATVQR